MTYVGRLAPSPTGAQHIGNARTFLIAWMVCRLAQGRLLLRIEDLDTPRTKKGAAEQAIEDLKWLGLTWDYVSSDTPYTTQSSYTIQSDRGARYAAVLNQLKRLGCIYPCTCTRSEIERAASAPHESILDGIVYPGTCSGRDPAESEDLIEHGVEFAWRFRMPVGIRSFQDEKYGLQSLDAKAELGDFIVARSSGVTAYQLAVVVDDHDFGINHVVRGNDLIYSTYRQMAIYNAMGWDSPAWLHLPLVVGLDGRRLAKRHGDTRLSFYREQGVAPERILGRIALTIGLLSEPRPITAAELLAIAKGKPDWLSTSPSAPILFDGKI